MRLLKSLATAVTVTVLASCAKENVPTTTVQQTVEMKNFRESLAVVARNSATNKIPLFSEQNHSLIIAQAKAFLLSEGYTDTAISSLNNNQIMQTALKLYAQKTQLNNNLK